MSHWIYNPLIYQSKDQTLVFDLQGDTWSVDTINWFTDSIVRMEARRYPGETSCLLILDLNVGEGRATRLTRQGSAHFKGTLAEIKNWVLSRKPLIYSHED
ncbi:hypothetical protein GO730_08015 [Spirosoma sp. HMF3257]|uniref:Uncharacterized protein n=1 Tax=Spirosoma telluris TaxID=2183553 RepID=A0A327NIV6_9BACT|nr:hypothetical protein [Spirosoma telluris]RAI74269.1 hypothetical protein HMF3257_07925 [Spirosoma telluris]